MLGISGNKNGASAMFWRTLIILAAGFVMSPVLGAAESPKPFPQFEAKRVKPPKTGSRKRILVQIDGQSSLGTAVQSDSTEMSPNGKATPPQDQYGWFWAANSPAQSDTGPGRLRAALNSLAAAPAGNAVNAPPLQVLTAAAQRHGTDILIASVGTDVSPALVLAVIAVESGGRVDAVSSAGAQGLMQLMPATAARFGVPEGADAAANIAGGIRYLDFLMQKFDRDPILVLAGYNAGENAIDTHKGVPPFAETRNYVPKVLAAYAVARDLCKTPPELITDGCIFAVN